jgi:hypothetical protein
VDGARRIAVEGSLKRLPAASLALLAPALAVLAAAPLQAASPASAVVQEILDGDELFIEGRQAHLKDRARAPEQVRTGDSRGQLGFDTGAAGRLNRFSRIRLGSTCFLLRSGQILVSGRQSGCVRSARLSVRGTNYVIGLTSAAEAAEVIVLEGELEVQRLVDGVPSGDSPTRLREASRARLSADGRVLAVERLSRAAVQTLLEGPLFRGFRSRLPDGEALQRSLRRNWPGLSLAAAAAPPAEALDASRDPLVRSINDARIANGRSPLEPLPPELARRNISYLQPVLAGMLRSGGCDHDRPRWQAIQAEAGQRYPLRPRSEVIACPRPTRTWNDDRIVARWLSSPVHRSILLDRPDASHIGCLRADAGGRSVAVCTLWAPTGSSRLTPR